MTDGSHPAWVHFAARVGTDDAARELFRSIFEDPHRAWLLDRVGTNPSEAKHVYAEEARRLLAAFRSATAKPKGAFVPMTSARTVVSKTDIATFFFLGSYADTDQVLHRAADGDEPFGPDLYGYLFANAPELRPGEEASPPIRKLIGAWLAARSAPATTRCFRLATDRGIREVLPAARAVAGNKDRSPLVRLAALETISRLGDRADLPLFVPLFSDQSTSVVAEPSVQVRDAAMAYALLLIGEDPTKYGFRSTRPSVDRAKRPVPPFADPRAFGFATDAARNVAHESARSAIEALLGVGK
jgi:hypothetical protein